MFEVWDDPPGDVRTEEHRKLTMKWYREISDKFAVDKKMLSVPKKKSLGEKFWRSE